MPRPKRSKVAPSAPTALYSRRTNEKISSIPTHVSSPKARSDVNSDDSEGLVKRSKSGRNSKGIAKQDYAMSGALAVGMGDDSSGRPKMAGGKERTELLRLARRKNGAPDGKATPVVLRSEPEVLVPSSMPESEEAAVARDSPRKDTVPRTIGKAAPSAELNWRTQATPRADSSVLSLANFKRRPRQPSILGIGRQDESVTLSSLGGSLSGEFDDDLADFHPDDESTPFHVSRIRPQSNLNLPQLPPTPAAAQTSSASRKRKITPPKVLIPRSQPSSSGHSEEDSESNFDVLNSPAPEEQEYTPTLPPPKRRAVTPPDIWSDTMAPPQSSSPSHSQEPEIFHHPSGSKTGTKSKTITRRKQTTRATPATRKDTRASKKQPLKPISTETLQTLLPRRRTTRQHDNAFNIPSDDDGYLYAHNSAARSEDEDELSFAPTTRRSKASKAMPSTGKIKRATLQPTKNTSTRTKEPSHKKPSHVATSSLSKTTPIISRTYSRRLSDKENQSASSSTLANNDDEYDLSTDSLLQPADDGGSAGDSSSLSIELPAAKKKEMAKLARKFAEVDRWEMEFEEVTASSSSPKDAR